MAPAWENRFRVSKCELTPLGGRSGFQRLSNRLGLVPRREIATPGRPAKRSIAPLRLRSTLFGGFKWCSAPRRITGSSRAFDSAVAGSGRDWSALETENAALGAGLNALRPPCFCRVEGWHPCVSSSRVRRGEQVGRLSGLPRRNAPNVKRG